MFHPDDKNMPQFLLLLTFPFPLSLPPIAIHLGDLTIKPNLELDRVRLQINRMVNSGSVTSTFSTGSRCDSPSHHPSRTQAFVRSHTTSYSSSASTESTESGEGDFKRLSASESLGDTSLSADWCFIDCKCVSYTAGVPNVPLCLSLCLC